MEEVPTQAHLAIDVDVGGLSSSSPYDADAANALAFDGCALFCATHHRLVRIARSISVLRWAPPPLMRMCQPHPPLGCISRLMRMCQPHPPLVRVSRSMGVCQPPPPLVPMSRSMSDIARTSRMMPTPPTLASPSPNTANDTLLMRDYFRRFKMYSKMY